jgi:HTH-type transcriptional regulator/antitoxin HigA
MAKTKAPNETHGRPAADRYFELVRRFPLRPIHSEDDLGRAVAVIDSLIDQGKLDRDEADYLDVLGDLVRKYETENHPMPAVSDADMLRHLIEARETTQAKVASETGIAESTVSEILAGKRGLSRRHIEALARYFHVSPAVFINV